MAGLDNKRWGKRQKRDIISTLKIRSGTGLAAGK